MTQPRDAARIMANGIENNRYHIYVGYDSMLMGIAVRIAPRLAVTLVQKAMAQMMPSTDAVPSKSE